MTKIRRNPSGKRKVLVGWVKKDWRKGKFYVGKRSSYCRPTKVKVEQVEKT